MHFTINYFQKEKKIVYVNKIKNVVGFIENKKTLYYKRFVFIVKKL